MLEPETDRYERARREYCRRIVKKMPPASSGLPSKRVEAEMAQKGNNTSVKRFLF